MFNRSQFRRGLDVFDRDGQKIGDVSDVGPNYIHVPTGFLGLGGDLYIPFSAVDRVTDQGAYLNVSKNDIPSRNWTTAPAAAAAGVTAREAAAPREAAPAGAMPSEAVPRARGATISPEEARGHNLCDVNGKQVGSIAGVGPSYFHVVTGLLGLGQDLYVPIDSIDYCSRDCCYLNIAADDIRAKGWTTRPGAEAPTERRMGAAGAPAREGVTEAERGGVYRIPLREETVEVSRHREQVGEVVISKEVVEEQRTIEVPVAHEEVRIERHPVTGEAARSEEPITDESARQTIRVPIYEERIDVEKHPHIAEEIVVSPEEVTRRERVTETVRREVPRMRTTGEAEEFVEGEETIEGKPAERTPEEIERERRQRRAGE